MLREPRLKESVVLLRLHCWLASIILTSLNIYTICMYMNAVELPISKHLNCGLQDYPDKCAGSQVLANINHPLNHRDFDIP